MTYCQIPAPLSHIEEEGKVFTLGLGLSYWTARKSQMEILFYYCEAFNPIDLSLSIAYSDGAPTLPRVCYLQPDIFGARDPAPQDYFLDAEIKNCKTHADHA
jgi:hypothetical protein